MIVYERKGTAIGLKQFNFEGLIPSMVYQEFPRRANCRKDLLESGGRLGVARKGQVVRERRRNEEIEKWGI
jgi:hypothetical protein